MEYLRVRNGWTIPVFDTIDRHAHGTMLKRMPTKRSHLIKFVHDILPTTGRLNRFDGGTRTCPLCDCTEEDRDHIMRCRHPSRAAWRQACIRKVTDYCNRTNTYPQLTRLMIKGLGQWFSGADPPLSTQINIRQMFMELSGNKQELDGNTLCSVALSENGAACKAGMRIGLSSHAKRTPR